LVGRSAAAAPRALRTLRAHFGARAFSGGAFAYWPCLACCDHSEQLAHHRHLGPHQGEFIRDRLRGSCPAEIKLTVLCRFCLISISALASWIGCSGLFILLCPCLTGEPSGLRACPQRTPFGFALCGIQPWAFCPIERPWSTRDTAATTRNRRVFIAGQKRGVFGVIQRELCRAPPSSPSSDTRRPPPALLP
jgi:hypothetical protein